MSLYAAIIAEDDEKKAGAAVNQESNDSKPSLIPPALLKPRVVVAPRGLVSGRKIPGNVPGTAPIPGYARPQLAPPAASDTSSSSEHGRSGPSAPMQSSPPSTRTHAAPGSHISGYDIVGSLTEELHAAQSAPPRERYDPRHPNDVDVILAQRERIARERERAREREQELERLHARAAAERAQQEEEAARRAQTSAASAGAPAASASVSAAPPTKAPFINSARMAALGLHHLAQPSPAPVQSPPAAAAEPVVDAEALVAPLSAPLSLLQSPTPTSSVIILNACARFRADATLKDEMAAECARAYGPVKNCQMCDLSLQGGPDNQCVRIFVKFESAAAALRAQRALKGRWFDGRELDCVFCKENLNL